MDTVGTYTQYAEFIKPEWAPPAWLFGPVWTVLYILIAISLAYILFQYKAKRIKGEVAAPFILNVVFNLLYTPIMFELGNMVLASIDIVLVLLTIIWMMRVAPKKWLVYINIPYLLWVSFATVLQLTILYLNW